MDSLKQTEAGRAWAFFDVDSRQPDDKAFHECFLAAGPASTIRDINTWKPWSYSGVIRAQGYLGRLD